VFLTSKPALRERILPLHSAWLDLFILRMMEPCVNPAKPVWFVLDELASLNKLPQLHTAVTESRKYGNPVVLGFQGRSQLEKRYGHDAETMLSQPATKIFFKTSEPRAAKWVSETLGEIEVERLKESRSPELIGSRKNYAMEIATKPLVMASEIAGLEPLHGFVKQENKVVPVTFAYVEKHSLQPAFIERNMTVREPRLLPSAVVPELPPAVIPPPKAIQAAVEAAPQPAFPLFADPACPEPTQPQPRKSAFKKSDGTGRVWKPLD
jgi:type IV secretory pathway TraG/TraD family ATPase VirD4